MIVFTFERISKLMPIFFSLFRSQTLIELNCTIRYNSHLVYLVNSQESRYVEKKNKLLESDVTDEIASLLTTLFR